MKLNKLITSICLTASTFLFVSNIAEAVNFTTNINQNTDAKNNIFLGYIQQNPQCKR